MVGTDVYGNREVNRGWYGQGKDGEMYHGKGGERESGERDRGRGREVVGDGFRYEHSRDPLLVVNIHKDGRVGGRRGDHGGRGREAHGGVRGEGKESREGGSKLSARLKPPRNVSLLNQEFTSSDSDLEADQLQVGRVLASKFIK